MSSKLPLTLLVAGATMLGAVAANAASYGPAFYPNDTFFAYSTNEELKNFAGQWHLVNTAPDGLTWTQSMMNTDGSITTVGGIMKNAHFDVNISGAWANGVTGAGVVIGIIDNGVEGDHEDLAENYRSDLSKNFSSVFGDTPQRPINPSDNHGTAVAGVAAARGGNGIGVTGAAPYAQIAGQRISLSSAGTADPCTINDVADAFYWQSGVDAAGKYIGDAQIHVKNNSWGSPSPFMDALNSDIGNTLNKQSPDMLGITHASANNVIFVFAAGNSRGDYYEQSQTTTRQGHEAAITVAALGSDGVFSYYSSLGPNVFVTAPSSSYSDTFGITTTDRMGILGYNSYVPPNAVETTPVALTNLPNSNYTNDFGGTSSASPLVAGIIALGKQVAPEMDVRLAKHALATTSRIVDATDYSLVASGGRGWVKNTAGNSFNLNYGFGLIDATAFVNKVIESAYITDRTSVSTGTVAVGKPIVVGDVNGVVQKFTIANALTNQPIETIETRIKVEGPGTWQDLHITLTSPTGTTGDLLLYNNILKDYPLALVADIYTSNNQTIPGFDWSFTANNFWGENAAGEWTLQAWNRGFHDLGGNINWAEYEVQIHMGKLVLESDAQSLRITNGVSIKAHSLNLDYANFNVETGGTFTVTDSINVYGGSVSVAGVLDEAAPNDNPGFFKGNHITVATGGLFRVESGGKVISTRGVSVTGGDFLNYGELDIGTGAVSVTKGGFFQTGQNLDVQNTLSVGEDGVGTPSLVVNTGSELDPKGTITVSTDLTLGAGLIYAPDSISVAGKSSVNGGRLVTTAYTGNEIILSGGALSANSLSATSVTVNYGILNIAGDISGTSATAPVSVFIGGEEDKNKRGWFSAGGIGPLGQDMRGAGSLLFEAKTAGAASPIGGYIATEKVNNAYVSRAAVINGSLSISQYGMLLVDAQNVKQPDGSIQILNDIVHVTGVVDFRGSLFINNLPDKDGNLPHPKVGDIITLITTETGANQIEPGQIDSSYATMAPTLRFDVRSRDKIHNDGTTETLIQNGEIYAIAIRDYAPAAANFTPNQKAVARMFTNLWYDYQRAKGLATSSDIPRLEPPSSATYGPVPFPPITRPANNDIAASPDAPDEYAYEEVFSSIDTVSTLPQLSALYSQLAPTNSVVLEQTFRQQARSQTAAIRSRTREARQSFIQPGSIWTSSLFGESYGFNYAQQYDGYNEDTPVTLWLNGGGSYTPGRGNKASAGYTSKAWNAAFGADYRFNNALLVGIQASYNGSSSNFKDSGMKNGSDSVLGAIYAAGHAAGFYYNGLAGYSADSHSLRRNLEFGAQSPLNGTHKGSPNGNSGIVSVELGYEWTTRGAEPIEYSPKTRDSHWSYGPSLALQYYHSTVNSYTETGGDLYNKWQRLSVAKQTYESLSTQLGAQISRVINLESVTILPEFRISWIHEFKTDAQSISARLAQIPGAESFKILGNKPSSDYANIGVGLTMRLSPNINATLNYDCYAFLRDSDPSHQLTATFRWSF